jgi:hypothetical protein
VGAATAVADMRGLRADRERAEETNAVRNEHCT